MPANPLRILAICLFLLILSGCATRQEATKGPEKYRADIEEMMPVPYTPRDDGQPLTSDELHAFKTVSDLDRDLSAEDARIVELHFKFFVHQHRQTFQRYLDRTARFLPYIRKVFTDRGIPSDIAYLCMVESGGNPNARSPAGAVGLWQFMPFTGKKFDLVQQNSWIDERRDPYKATYAASDYLLKLYTDFADWPLAIAAYNAGEGKIGRAVSGTGAQDFFELCRLDGQLEERARLREETRMYVPRVIAVAKIMRNLRRLGFREPSPDEAWDLTPITVPSGTNLAGLARHLGLTWDEFSGMNPAFRRTASPPNSSATAYVPPAQMASAVNWLADRESRSYADWREYTVKKGDTLASIAKRHKVTVAAIREANGFQALPKRGTNIMIPGRGSVEPVYDALPATASAASASAGTYVVKPGDTLFELAHQWGTDVASIRLANRMGSKDVMLPGQRISIPGNSTNKPAASSVKKSEAAAPPSKSSTSAQAASGGSSYTVQSGDSVYGIAQKTGVSVQALCLANNLNPSKPLIRSGQRLAIPGKEGPATQVKRSSESSAKPVSSAGGKSAPASSGKAKSVTVKPGETLYSIARANGVSVQALQKANKLGANANIKSGQKLIIP